MNVEYETCTSGVDIPEDGALYAFLIQFGTVTGTIFVLLCVFLGPVNVAINLFVMFLLTRKELRSTYNFVFFLMTLDQTIIIGSLSIAMIKSEIFGECKPWFFSYFWALFDLIITKQFIGICKAHATWLAVIVALMRLRSIRSRGASEMQFNLVFLLSAAAMVFVIVVNTPYFFGFWIVWLRLDNLCETKEIGDTLVPFVLQSPALFQNDCLLLRLSSLLSGALHSTLPCLLLILFSLTLLRYLKKMRKERTVAILQRNVNESQDGDRTTTLLLLIILTTMISEVPTGILSFLERFLSYKMRTQLTSRIGLLFFALMLPASACNLFIYLFMSKTFREVARNYVCCCCRSARKTGPQTSSNNKITTTLSTRRSTST